MAFNYLVSVSWNMLVPYTERYKLLFVSIKKKKKNPTNNLCNRDQLYLATFLFCFENGPYTACLRKAVKERKFSHISVGYSTFALPLLVKPSRTKLFLADR